MQSRIRAFAAKHGWQSGGTNDVAKAIATSQKESAHTFTKHLPDEKVAQICGFAGCAQRGTYTCGSAASPRNRPTERRTPNAHLMYAPSDEYSIAIAIVATTNGHGIHHLALTTDAPPPITNHPPPTTRYQEVFKMQG